MPELDTLVFRYRETLNDNHAEDENRICLLDVFVLYDYEHNMVAMYGVSYKGTHNNPPAPFHFLFHRVSDAQDFLRCLSNKLHPSILSLYALKGVPILMEDISYDRLYKLSYRTSELISHYEPYLDESLMRKMFGFVQKAFTLYEYSDEEET